MRQIVKPLLVCVVVIAAGCSHFSKKHAAEAAPVASSEAVPEAVHETTNARASGVDVATVAHSIRLCRTQYAELQQQLGQPTRDGILHKQHLVSWTVQADAPRRELAVMLNAQNTVVDLYWNVSSAIPWNPVDQCLSP